MWHIICIALLSHSLPNNDTRTTVSIATAAVVIRLVSGIGDRLTGTQYRGLTEPPKKCKEISPRTTQNFSTNQCHFEIPSLFLSIHHYNEQINWCHTIPIGTTPYNLTHPFSFMYVVHSHLYCIWLLFSTLISPCRQPVHRHTTLHIIIFVWKM